RLASPQIAPRQITVLRLGVDDVRIAGIDAIVECIAALDREPVLIADAELLGARTRTAPGIIVLQSAATAVRLPKIARQLVKLGERDVVDVPPRAAAIFRGPHAAVITDYQVVRIRGVDPDRVNVAMYTLEAVLVECLAAIFRHVDVDASQPDFAVVVRIYADLAEVR